MNSRNEHTMTIFQRTVQGPASNVRFTKIAELEIDGSIIIQETPRSLAYQQGIAIGQSYTIIAYSYDNSSDNILDQLEIGFTFNTVSGQYEQSSITRIPGSQIEQRRIRELLSGIPGVFENFIHDLWYFVSPQGTHDSRQYMYFNPVAKEVIFFDDDSLQVFNWLGSTSTRYGMYIRSQNISISTLRRAINIELESLDSIRLRVTEDVQLKIAVSESWDGSYRRAGTRTVQEKPPSVRPAINSTYDSYWGRIRFNDLGEYTITSGGEVTRGRYVFFTIDENELLELRPEQGSDNRMVFRYNTIGDSSLSLSSVRLGAMGVHDMLDMPVILTHASGE
jgi:hypothetical protein